MKDPNRFYTYAYLREDGTPYYIGKGTGDRAHRKDRRVRPPRDNSRIVFLKQNLTEEEAFKHEIYMIAVYGRKDLGTGILHNRTDGGEGASGYVPSEDSRRRRSENMRGEKNHRYGKSPSRETRKKRSESLKGEKNPMYGKSYSEETKRKWSEQRTGRKLSQKTRQKLSKLKKGKNIGGDNHNYGKKLWNDGNGNNKLSIECPGEGWVLGGTPREYISKLKWWNDGQGNNKRSVECPGEGWILGRGEEYKKKMSIVGSNPSEETRSKMREAKLNKKWWHDGHGNIKLSKECPGDGWMPGIK